MTDQELHDAIAAVPAAKAAADVGNDSGAAALLAATLPPVLVETLVTEREIIAAFADPADGQTALKGFEAAAANSPLFARVNSWLSPERGGVDVGAGTTRTSIDQLATAGAMTTVAAATIKALAERPAVVDPAQVSRAWAQYRPNGKVQAP